MNLFKNEKIRKTILTILFVSSLSFYINLELNSEKVHIEKLQVQRVYNKLALVSGTQKMVPLVVLQSPIINAWTDGFNITITTGMLKLIKNNHELAMVLGHEMAHVLAGDTTRDGQPIDPNFIEANADKLGAYIMMRAGYDPCIGKEIMRTFKDKFGDDASAQGHPGNAYRLDQLDLPQCH